MSPKQRGCIIDIFGIIMIILGFIVPWEGFIIIGLAALAGGFICNKDE